MRFAGIDIGSEHHVAAVIDEQGHVLSRPTRFSEDASGHGQLFGFIGPADDLQVAMEATGHYWRNLFVALVTRGYAVEPARFRGQLGPAHLARLLAPPLHGHDRQSRPRVIIAPSAATVLSAGAAERVS